MLTILGVSGALLVGHEGHYLDNVIDNFEWQCFVSSFFVVVCVTGSPDAISIYMLWIAEPSPTTNKLFFVEFEVFTVMVMKSSGI
jgi:hypothetical protein